MFKQNMFKQKLSKNQQIKSHFKNNLISRTFSNIYSLDLLNTNLSSFLLVTSKSK